MAAGYSKRLLIEKLGIKPHSRVLIVNDPLNYRRDLGKLPEGIVLHAEKEADFIQFFTDSRSELEKEFPLLKKKIAYSGMIWISWPKGGSGMKTDLTENVVREIGLREGMVDVKVCAVTEIWSGLKFVYRIKDRK